MFVQILAVFVFGALCAAVWRWLSPWALAAIQDGAPGLATIEDTGGNRPIPLSGKVEALSNRIDAMELRFSTELAHVESKSQSWVGRVTGDLENLRYEVRAVDTFRAVEVREMADDLQELTAAARTLGAEVDRLDSELNKRVLSLIEVQRTLGERVGELEGRTALARDRSVEDRIDEALAASAALDTVRRAVREHREG
jgi:hypothetical protein